MGTRFGSKRIRLSKKENDFVKNPSADFLNMIVTYAFWLKKKLDAELIQKDIIELHSF
jgi:hypothetical protein